MPLFLFIFHILYIHTFIQSQFIHPSPLAEASLHFFIACMLSGDDLPVVPSRESNSGLPYSKPTRGQLSHAAPYNLCAARKIHLLIQQQICSGLGTYINKILAHSAYGNKLLAYAQSTAKHVLCKRTLPTKLLTICWRTKSLC